MFKVGGYYKDGNGNLNVIVSIDEEKGQMAVRYPKAVGALCWHWTDGRFFASRMKSTYDLLPQEYNSDGTPICVPNPIAAEPAPTPAPPDPSIWRDEMHKPLPIPGRTFRDNFPDLEDWSVSSGTQEQPKPSTGWWARWS